MAHILLLNGPNLNMLGKRQPEVYGSETLADVVSACRSAAHAAGRTLEDFQSNSEGDMIDRIHAARGNVSAIIINPGGWTHTSVALRDALVIPDVPIVEVHISNVHAREEFRHHSFVSPVATGVIAGLGTFGYLAAIDYLVQRHSRPMRILVAEDDVRLAELLREHEAAARVDFVEVFHSYQVASIAVMDKSPPSRLSFGHAARKVAPRVEALGPPPT